MWLPIKLKNEVFAINRLFYYSKTNKIGRYVCWSNIIIYDCFSNLFIKVKKIRTHIQCHISAIHQRENG